MVLIFNVFYFLTTLRFKSSGRTVLFTNFLQTAYSILRGQWLKTWKGKTSLDMQRSFLLSKTTTRLLVSSAQGYVVVGRSLQFQFDRHSVASSAVHAWMHFFFVSKNVLPFIILNYRTKHRCHPEPRNGHRVSMTTDLQRVVNIGGLGLAQPVIWCAEKLAAGVWSTIVLTRRRWGMSVNTKMERRTITWVLVINERAWFFLVHLDSMQRGKIDVLRKGLFHCGGLQSRGVKQENSADEPCFNVFTCFDGIIQLF